MAQAVCGGASTTKVLVPLSNPNCEPKKKYALANSRYVSIYLTIYLYIRVGNGQWRRPFAVALARPKC